MTDTDRLDYLEAVIRARMGFVDVNLSGIRLADEEARLFKIEYPGTLALSAPSLREAIDQAEKNYPRVRM
jgi:hypothetical protein